MFLPFIRRRFKGKIITNIDGSEWRRDKWKWYAKFLLKFSEKMAVRYSDIVIGDNNCKNIILFFCDSNKILYKTSFNGFFCLLLAFKNGENFFLRDFRFILYKQKKFCVNSCSGVHKIILLYKDFLFLFNLCSLSAIFYITILTL